MNEVTCYQCGVVFHAQRKTAKFCDPVCRKAAHEVTRRGIRKRDSQNRRTSPEQARREDRFFEAHMRMCETYYCLPPMERPAYLFGLITQARQGNSQIKRILTNHLLLRPSGQLQRRVIFWRAASNYPTIAQEANTFCKWHFGAGIKLVIENPSRKPLPDAHRRFSKMKQQEYEEQLAAIQKKTLPSLPDRPEHVVKAVVLSIVGKRGPTQQQQESAHWEADGLSNAA